MGLSLEDVGSVQPPARIRSVTRRQSRGGSTSGD